MLCTSYFSKIKYLENRYPEMVFINISGKAPDWFLKDYGLEYRKLAPKYVWWSEWYERFKDNLESSESKKWYIKKYQETVLDKLDVYSVKSDLYNISNNAKQICMLCHETPEKFCHRHLVADWFRKFDIQCFEIF